MSYLVGENCIKCKHMDCIEVCPVDCFYEGENFLVINPDECIDCAVCEPACPVGAIVPEFSLDEAEHDKWFDINEKYSRIWPNVTVIKDEALLPDPEKWDGVPNKFEEHFSPNPGKGD